MERNALAQELRDRALRSGQKKIASLSDDEIILSYALYPEERKNKRKLREVDQAIVNASTVDAFIQIVEQWPNPKD